MSVIASDQGGTPALDLLLFSSVMHECTSKAMFYVNKEVW